MSNKQNFLIICLGSVGSGYQQGQDINKGNMSEREREQEFREALQTRTAAP